MKNILEYLNMNESIDAGKNPKTLKIAKEIAKITKLKLKCIFTDCDLGTDYDDSEIIGDVYEIIGNFGKYNEVAPTLEINIKTHKFQITSDASQLEVRGNVVVWNDGYDYVIDWYNIDDAEVKKINLTSIKNAFKNPAVSDGFDWNKKNVKFASKKFEKMYDDLDKMYDIYTDEYDIDDYWNHEFLKKIISIFEGKTVSFNDDDLEIWNTILELCEIENFNLNIDFVKYMNKQINK